MYVCIIFAFQIAIRVYWTGCNGPSHLYRIIDRHISKPERRQIGYPVKHTKIQNLKEKKRCISWRYGRRLFIHVYDVVYDDIKLLDSFRVQLSISKVIGKSHERVRGQNLNIGQERMETEWAKANKLMKDMGCRKGQLLYFSSASNDGRVI